MPYTNCKEGHLYDPELYSSCPYCGKQNNVIDFMNNSAPKTVAPIPEASDPGNDRIMGQEKVQEPTKTIAPPDLEGRKTISSFKKRYDYEPVVGWLACIEGAVKGKSFPVFLKINTVGRSDSSDVRIDYDDTVSEKHAKIAYDPKHNVFRVMPYESSNNIYLNDEPVYIPTMLEAFDIIELGDTKLIFVPLCCDRFKWEDSGKTEEKT